MHLHSPSAWRFRLTRPTLGAQAPTGILPCWTRSWPCLSGGHVEEYLQRLERSAGYMRQKRTGRLGDCRKRSSCRVLAKRQCHRFSIRYQGEQSSSWWRRVDVRPREERYYNCYAWQYDDGGLTATRQTLLELRTKAQPQEGSFCGETSYYEEEFRTQDPATTTRLR